MTDLLPAIKAAGLMGRGEHLSDGRQCDLRVGGRADGDDHEAPGSRVRPETDSYDDPSISVLPGGNCLRVGLPGSWRGPLRR